MLLDFVGLFLLLAGFVIGLGAVTVIDVHGFLGRRSSYWSEATTRTHKITKPLIWIGIVCAIIGGGIFFRENSFTGIPVYLFFYRVCAYMQRFIFVFFGKSISFTERKRRSFWGPFTSLLAEENICKPPVL